MEIGDVYLPTDPRIDKHPRVVISDPDANPEAVVLVNFTGAEDEYRDHSCILEIGEHPWLRKRTCISYKDASLIEQDSFDKLLANKKMTKLQPVSNEVLTKILEGAEINRRVAQ
ncbi:MAG: hypothetical protein SGI77_26540 [Pirellulaceae bacterium]|nr:hypothetical protein [Pirellulaceae bacterium]